MTLGTSSSSGRNQQQQQQQQPQPHTRTTCVYVRSPALAFYLDFENGPETATVEMIRDAIFASTKFASDATLAKQVFTVWLISSRLELQLKPNHRPLAVYQSWPALVKRYCSGRDDDFSNGDSRVQLPREVEQPLLMLQRNLFLSVQTERRIRDESILANLYEEARFNVVNGRYPCVPQQLIMLAALQARIEFGTFDPIVHTVGYFRDRRSHFLPFAVCNRKRLFTSTYLCSRLFNWLWLPATGTGQTSIKNSIENRLVDAYRALPVTLTRTKAIREYMRFCWTMPFYGSAFFKGQLETVHGSWLYDWMFRDDMPVLIAINSNGLYVIDDRKCELVLALRYDQLNWDYAEPSLQSANYNDRYCLPCLFVQFQLEIGNKNVPVSDLDDGNRLPVQSQSKRALKFLQIFSKQAKLMDLLIANFVHIWKNGQVQTNRRTFSAGGRDECDEIMLDYYTSDPSDNQCHLSDNCLSVDDTVDGLATDSVHIPGYKYENRLDRLALTTFNEQGQCVDKMGTWSFL